MKTKANKKAISLIVLVITIIVMIVLAGAIILSLNNSGIIGKANEAVKSTDEATVKEIAALGWAEAYANGARTVDDLKEGVLSALKKNNISTEEYFINVTTSGVEIFKLPQGWSSSVQMVVDGVPIPKGFVASKATGENTKSGGLVIYEGNEEVNDTNVESAKRTRNQYVWVPVIGDSSFVRKQFGNADERVGVPSSDFPIEESTPWEAIPTLDLSQPEVEIVNPDWEECIAAGETEESCRDVHGIKQSYKYNLSDYVTSTTLQEVIAMYASVTKYGGFYIARYEAGIDVERNGNDGTLVTGLAISSKMNKKVYTYISLSETNTATTAKELARGIYTESNSDYGVVSTLVYGVQWDATLQWWLDSGAVKSVTESDSYGNYEGALATAGVKINQGAQALFTGSEYENLTDSSIQYNGASNVLITTGAVEDFKVNNIYDMAGNVLEATMEKVVISGEQHVVGRGGFNGLPGSSNLGPVAVRSDGNACGPNCASDAQFGFRIALYIK